VMTSSQRSSAGSFRLERNSKARDPLDGPDVLGGEPRAPHGIVHRLPDPARLLERDARFTRGSACPGMSFRAHSNSCAASRACADRGRSHPGCCERGRRRDRASAPHAAPPRPSSGFVPTSPRPRARASSARVVSRSPGRPADVGADRGRRATGREREGQ
jgi:hypothetical protein